MREFVEETIWLIGDSRPLGIVVMELFPYVLNNPCIAYPPLFLSTLARFLQFRLEIELQFLNAISHPTHYPHNAFFHI